MCPSFFNTIFYYHRRRKLPVISILYISFVGSPLIKILCNNRRYFIIFQSLQYFSLLDNISLNNRGVQLSPIASGGSLSVTESILECAAKEEADDPPSDHTSDDVPGVRHTSSQTYSSSLPCAGNLSSTPSRVPPSIPCSEVSTELSWSQLQQVNTRLKGGHATSRQHPFGLVMPPSHTTIVSSPPTTGDSGVLTLPGLVCTSGGGGSYHSPAVCCSLPNNPALSSLFSPPRPIVPVASQTSMTSVPSRVSLQGCQVRILLFW